MTYHLKTAIKAARDSGIYIKNKVGKIGRLEYKSATNLVTDIDKGSETKIIKTLRKAFPEYSILTEERGSIGKDICGYKWVVDPLDGTTNFAHGFTFFCVSIALEHNGEAVVGVVFDPMRDELFHAEKGKGAFLNGKKIRVSSIREIKRSLLSTGFAYNFREQKRNNFDNFMNFYSLSQGVRRCGSAALDISYTACGRFDGFWEMNLRPWDTAAAVLILKEAGGAVSRFDGSGFSNYGKEILVSNRHVHRQMTKVLNMRKKRCLKY